MWNLPFYLPTAQRASTVPSHSLAVRFTENHFQASHLQVSHLRASQLQADKQQSGKQQIGKQQRALSNVLQRSTGRLSKRRVGAQLPMQPGFALTSESDSGVLGDAKTSSATVGLVGLTSPNATVRLEGVSLTTTADAAGKFLFSNLPLTVGVNQFTAVAQIGSKQRSFTAAIERTTTDNTDAVLDWNATLLRTIQNDRAGSLETARTLAIAHAAIYDVVNALVGDKSTYRPVLTTIPVAASTSAAVAGAAYEVLTQLYPDQKAALDVALTVSLNKIQDPETTETSGLEFGQAVAKNILAERSNDGSTLTATFKPKLKPGKWRPTPPRFLSAAAVAWRNVTPFVLNEASQFRPVAPPKLTSRTYAKDLNQVKRLGQIDSRYRTDQQTETARFWLGNAGSVTLPGMWNEVAAQAAVNTNQTLLQNAQLFTQLNFALADASIAAWDAKYTYRTWRPITAIRLADSDKNAATQADANWQSFLETPAHPDYVSSHSSLSGAAAAVLTNKFGNYRFSVTSLDLPGVQRSFGSFEQAADQAGMSRIYGGIHTQSANQAGLKLGKKIGNYVLRSLSTKTTAT